MKKNNICKKLLTKRVIYGGYATVVTLIFIVLMIVLNLAIGKFDFKMDLTENKIFSLSEQSKQVITSLKTNVKITALFASGNEDPNIKEILAKYEGKSSKITIDYKDPDLYPQLVKKYSKNNDSVRVNSLIIENGEKYKVIDPSKFIQNVEDYSGRIITQVLALEQRITGAIMYVSNEERSTLFQLKGHEEAEFVDSVKTQLEAENYTIKELDLLKEDWTPQNGDVLAIISPKRDISLQEEEILRQYFENGGRALIYLDLLNQETPNLQDLLQYYGVAIRQAAIVEGKPENSYNSKNPLFLMPNMSDHPILKELNENKLRVLVPIAQPIEIAKVKRQTVEVIPLLTTSDSAWAKVNLNSNTLEKEAGDLSGSFNVAVAIGDGKNLEDLSKNPKLVVASSALILDEEAIGQSNSTNLDFFMNSISWVGNRKQSITVRPKDVSVQALRINASQQMLYSGVVIILMPVLVGVIGLFIWLRRRHL
jgi:hypothetical protein